MSLPLLSSTDLNALFNRDAYRRVVSKDPTLPAEQRDDVIRHILQYAIGLREPEGVILELIARPDSKEKICTPFSHLKLTPLHLAIITDNVAVGIRLMDAGANLIQKDAQGWQPIHMAAITSHRLFDALINRKVSPNTFYNRLGGDCRDLRRLVGLDPTEEKILLYREPGAAAVAHINIDEYKRRTGLREYSDVSRYSPYDLWMQNVGPESIVNERVKRCLMKSSPLTSTGVIEGMGPRNHALFAEEDIYLGRCIGIYSGKKEGIKKNGFLEEDSESYFVEGLNSRDLGNEIRFANDGFPNCSMIPCYNRGGLEVSYALIATNPGGIKSGEQILWDYLPVAAVLKWSDYRIQNRGELFTFFKNPLSNYVRIDKEMEGKIAHSFDFGRYSTFIGLRYKLFYPLTTPMALIDLTLNLIVEPRAWLEVVKTELGQAYMERFLEHMTLISALLPVLQKFWVILHSDDPNIERVKDFFNRGMHKFSVMQLIFAIDWICKGKFVDWNSEGIFEERISSFRWQEDKHFFLTRLVDIVRAR